MYTYCTNANGKANRTLTTFFKRTVEMRFTDNVRPLTKIGSCEEYNAMQAEISLVLNFEVKVNFTEIFFNRSIPIRSFGIRLC
jgi:hypothetical protein